MKLLIRISLALCAVAIFSNSANAQYWSGWWGAGYYGSPVYAAPVYTSYYRSPSYTSFYGSYSSVSPSYGCCGTAAPVYSVSYGSGGSGCCATPCCGISYCDACSSGCASGSCASGSCAGVTPTGSLKPTQDPISDKKSPDYDGETRPRRFNPNNGSGTDDPLDPIDSGDRKDPFTRPKSGTGGGTSSGSGAGTFEEDNTDPALDRTLQKPPMTDPLDGKALDPIESDPGKPVDENTFFEDTSGPDNSASLGRDNVVARRSLLSEVIAPKRLASRSLPANQRSASASRLAEKSNNTKSDTPRALRWISAPLADGHVQL